MRKIFFVAIIVMSFAVVSCKNGAKDDSKAEEQTAKADKDGESAQDAADMTGLQSEEAETSATEAGESQPELSFADLAGIYECVDEDGYTTYRLSLGDDGTATWVVVGSLNYTEFTYTIEGSSICLDSMDGDSEKDCLDYDPVKKTLSTNATGVVYERQPDM
ncbi:MAG: hypothetical protein K6G08_04130 [Prevotella sp.]|nr:hypothetical protein [Prevotella sp.]